MDIKIILAGLHNGSPIHAEIVNARRTYDEPDGLSTHYEWDAIWMLTDSGERMDVDLGKEMADTDDGEVLFTDLYEDEIINAIDDEIETLMCDEP